MLKITLLYNTRISYFLKCVYFGAVVSRISIRVCGEMVVHMYVPCTLNIVAQKKKDN